MFDVAATRRFSTASIAFGYISPDYLPSIFSYTCLKIEPV